jgi:hypothetical protein
MLSIALAISIASVPRFCSDLAYGKKDQRFALKCAAIVARHPPEALEPECAAALSAAVGYEIERGDLPAAMARNIPDCIADVERRRTETKRIAAAAERERVEREQQRAALQAARDAQRQADDAALQAHEDEVGGIATQLYTDSTKRKALLSGVICAHQKRITDAKALIADERRKAQVAGVVDKSVLNEAGEEIVSAEKGIAWARKAVKGKPLSCSKEEAKSVSDCLHNEECMESNPGQAMTRTLQWIRDE